MAIDLALWESNYIRKLTKYFLSFYGFFVPFWTFCTYQTFLGEAPHNPKVQKGQKVRLVHEKSKKQKSPYNPYSTIVIVTANKAKCNRCVTITTLVVVRFLHRRTASLGGNHQHISKASTIARLAVPGQKVGLIAAHRTGLLCSMVKVKEA